MIRFTPDRKISYKLIFRPAGKPFEIDDADAEVMAAYGKVDAVHPAATDVSADARQTAAPLPDEPSPRRAKRKGDGR